MTWPRPRRRSRWRRCSASPHSTRSRTVSAATAPPIDGLCVGPRADRWSSSFAPGLRRRSPNCPPADAIRYALNHWDGLARFLDDGRIELDTKCRALHEARGSIEKEQPVRRQ
ncbi:MAG: IS66 family transposase [Acetobacteraceae bacterium]